MFVIGGEEAYKSMMLFNSIIRTMIGRQELLSRITLNYFGCSTSQTISEQLIKDGATDKK